MLSGSSILRIASTTLGWASSSELMMSESGSLVTSSNSGTMLRGEPVLLYTKYGMYQTVFFPWSGVSTVTIFGVMYAKCSVHTLRSSGSVVASTFRKGLSGSWAEATPTAQASAPAARNALMVFVVLISGILVRTAIQFRHTPYRFVGQARTRHHWACIGRHHGKTGASGTGAYPNNSVFLPRHACRTP